MALKITCSSAPTNRNRRKQRPARYVGDGACRNRQMKKSEKYKNSEGGDETLKLVAVSLKAEREMTKEKECGMRNECVAFA